MAGAEAEGEAIARLAAHADFADLATKGVPAADIAAISRHVIAGRAAQARGRHEEAAAAFREAAAIQDRLPYMEPPFWYYPVRQSLGAAYLQAGNVQQAEAAFRASLERVPHNAWALFGLHEALASRGEVFEREEVARRLRSAWAGETKLLLVSRL